MSYQAPDLQTMRWPHAARPRLGMSGIPAMFFQDHRSAKRFYATFRGKYALKQAYLVIRTQIASWRTAWKQGRRPRESGRRGKKPCARLLNPNGYRGLAENNVIVLFIRGLAPHVFSRKVCLSNCTLMPQPHAEEEAVGPRL